MFGTKQLTTSDEVKVGVELYARDTESEFATSLAPIRLDPVVIPLSCSSDENGSINVESGLSNATYTWSDGSNQPFLNNVAPGTYSVTVSNGQNYPVYATYHVGRRVVWSPVSNFQWPNTTNTIQHDGTMAGSAPALAEARSINRFQDVNNIDAWASFEVVNGIKDPAEPVPGGWPSTISTFPYSVYFGFWNETVPGLDYALWAMGGNTPSLNTLWAYDGNTWSPVGSFMNGDRLKLSKEGSFMRIYRNNNLVHTMLMSTPNSTHHYSIKTATPLAGNQVKEALCNFKCDIEQSSAVLSRQLDGQEFFTFDHSLHFTYDGEYNTGTLDYRILSESGADLTASVGLTEPGGTATTSNAFCDNRYILDFNQVPKGYYTLEITNEKNERYSLRIYKEL